jgi:hypothetical protein
VSVLLALNLIPPAAAHRLDEYLQATLIGPARKATDVEIQLTPGVAMLPILMAVIDQDRDGRISPAEEQAYVSRVAREVELRVDGVPAPLSLLKSEFPTVEAMRQGLGIIRIDLRASRGGHRLHFENRHLPQVSVYLVNCLASSSDRLVVGRQERDPAQRSIAFEYSFEGAEPTRSGTMWSALVSLWPAAIGLLLAVRIAVLLYGAKQGKRASKSCTNS